jgi:hypothetical protein
MNLFQRYLLFMSGAVLAFATVFLLVIYQVEKSELPSYTEFIKADQDILFFGDSVLYSFGECEADKTTIDDWFRRVSGESVLTLSHRAFSPIIYAEYTELLPQIEGSYRYAIIPINLRSFSDEWFTRPQFNFRRETTILKLTAGQIDLATLSDFVLYSATNYVDRLELEWMDQEVNYATIDLGQRSQFLDIFKRNFKGIADLECLDQVTADMAGALALRYQYHYANEITSGHGMFNRLARTHANLLNAGIEPIYYITPVNHEAVAQYSPAGLNDHIAKNVATITNWLQQRNALFVDMSFDLHDARFSEKQCACEHLDESGRQHVANRLSSYLKDI